MKKLIVLLLVVFMITACATVKPKTNVTINQHQYSISGKYSPGLFTDQITLYVNDQEIGTGTISQLGNLTTHISGASADGTIFDADCGLSMSGLLSIRCLVYVKGEKVADVPL
jgi:hypothetical protein